MDISQFDYDLDVNLIAQKPCFPRDNSRLLSCIDNNYKDLFFDELQIEADNLKINFKLTTKELKFINDPLIKFKISLTQSSLRTILLSKNWHWIGDKISKEILNEEKLIDIKKSINLPNNLSLDVIKLRLNSCLELV